MKSLAFWTLCTTYFLIVFGGYVASSNSGMGCGPDWPLCNGVLIPVLKGATLIEYAHRLIGALLTLLTVMLCLRLWRSSRSGTDRFVSAAAAVLLAIQIILGAFVVWFDLPPIVVTTHFFIAFLFLGCLLWIWRRAHHSPHLHQPVKRTSIGIEAKRHIHLLFVLLAATLLLGAYVKHQHYGLSCGWLTCGEQLWPSNEAQMWQTAHRTAAAATVLYTIWTAFVAHKRRWGRPLERRLLLAAAVGLLQVVIGVITVATEIRLSWAIIHLAVGTWLALLLIDLNIYLHMSVLTRRSSVPRRMGEHPRTPAR
ncbi:MULTISPECIES: COX15/CtaA family protein [Geobacillus]|jgi:cytochrome c oxidase assembly protein subunit 15|nr:MULTISPECIES: COX15/CtaA family protein [Geobacillus]KQB93452.1 cytochrome AA3 biosynthesis protein [Geobacillus sp. PA-3]MED3716856.1 COX15/CtaA family protein [Geobacillus thermodenitrificans]MED4916135.1 COX15/CtaA family protein [Geobacillus thermodenitrificans]